MRRALLTVQTRPASILLFAVLGIAPQLVFGSTGTWLTINVDGADRRAFIFAPSAPADKAPVILAFHGHGGNPNGAARAMAFQDAWPEALIVYPQGAPTITPVDPQGLRPGWQRSPGEIGDRDLHFVDALLTKLRAQYGVDEHRIFAAGFSNGAFFTYLLWSQRPQAFAAFAAVAGLVDVAGPLRMPKPAVQIGGRADRLVRLPKLEQTMTAVRELNGCARVGQPCGDGCVRYSSSKNAAVIDWIHPGPHVYPSRATSMIIHFFRGISAQ